MTSTVVGTNRDAVVVSSTVAPVANSIDALSAAPKGCPLWKVTPWRRMNCQVVSSICSQLSASPGVKAEKSSVSIWISNQRVAVPTGAGFARSRGIDASLPKTPQRSGTAPPLRPAHQNATGPGLMRERRTKQWEPRRHPVQRAAACVNWRPGDLPVMQFCRQNFQDCSLVHGLSFLHSRSIDGSKAWPLNLPRVTHR